MKLKIENSTLAGHTARVWIDDQLALDVEKIVLCLEAGELTRATITFLPRELSVEVEAIANAAP